MKLVYDFKGYLENSGFSRNTVEAYISDISDYLSILKITSAGEITAQKTDDYLKNLLKTGLTNAKINRKVSAIRSFFKYLDLDIRVKNPASRIKREKMPVILTKNEVVKFLSMPQGENFKAVRDRLLLSVLYYTGIKVSELSDLTVYDINFQIGTVIIRGQNGRVIPVNDSLLADLNYYIKSVRPVISDGSEYLFLNTKGGKMTRQGIWKTVTCYSDKSNTEKEITPNTLRHSFATHLIDNGADIKYVKELLGLDETTSAKVYTEYLKEQYKGRYLK